MTPDEQQEQERDRQYSADLAELHRELYEAMSPAAQRSFVRGLSKKERARHEKAMAGARNGVRATAYSSPAVVAELDRAFGTAPPRPAVVNTPHQSTYDAGGTTTRPRSAAAAASVGGRAPALAEKLTRGAPHPREWNGRRITSRSPDADLLDRMMGFEPDPSKQRRDPYTRTYGGR